LTKRVTVIGGGAWGTTLAFLLADKGHPVKLWLYENELAQKIQRDRENSLYLPGVKLPYSITATNSFEEAIAGCELILFVVPSHVARSVLTQLAPYLPAGVPIVCATKGIETESLMLMSEVLKDVLPVDRHSQFAFLSGPSFAKEVCLRLPTAVSLAATDHDLAVKLQAILATAYFKVFTTTDVVGVQVGGALKNVIALAAGGADGMGFGTNTRAALITRGLVEIMRLGVAMGAQARTFYGLSGMGDLVLTCTGELSRNRNVGFKIGQGMKLSAILAEMKTVAEGVNTAQSAYQLAQKHQIKMPIVEQIYAVLFQDKNPREAVTDLMEQATGVEVEASDLDRIGRGPRGSH
jgi:glycerol-3-phosphate dehydrogenase (NAD(P)+)